MKSLVPIAIAAVPCLPVEQSALPPRSFVDSIPASCPKGVKDHRTAVPWPKGLTAVAMRHCPEFLREDAIQEAWLALAEGRKPDSAVRALIRREVRQRALSLDADAIDPSKVKAYL